MSDQLRLQWIFRILLLAIIGTLVFTGNVWLTDRNFPLLGLIEGMPVVPHPLDYILYCVMIVLALYQLVNLENRQSLIALLCLFAFQMLQDQMRWQPYNVHYLLLLAGFLVNWNDGTRVLNTFRMTFVVFFIWGGIQEMNQGFADRVFPYVWAKNIAEWLPARFEHYITDAGYLFALLNLATGICLLFPKTRRYAVIAGITIHAFLVISMDPLANEGIRVLPLYSLVSAAILYFAFYDTEFEPKSLFWSPLRYQQIAFIFFACLPILSFFGLYDKMQSFNLYSGKGTYSTIYLSEQLVQRLPEGYKRYVDRPEGSMPSINTTYWAWNELNVGPYSEQRIQDRLLRHICSFDDGECTAKIESYSY